MRSFEQRVADSWLATASHFASRRAARARLEAEGRIDPTCRFAKTNEAHLCSRRDLTDLEPGMPCYAEAFEQVREAGQTLREAEIAADGGIDEPGVSDLCRDDDTMRRDWEYDFYRRIDAEDRGFDCGPVYRLIDLAESGEA